MATKVTKQLIDDIDGSPADETIRFSVGRTAYEIDVNSEHAEEFHEQMAAWIGSARKAPAARRNPQARRSPKRQTQIRKWARKNGYDVADRGRIPSDVVNAYEAANS